MQQIPFDRQKNREFQGPMICHGCRATHFAPEIVRLNRLLNGRVVTRGGYIVRVTTSSLIAVAEVAGFFQRIGSCFFGAAFWLKDRVTGSSLSLERAHFDTLVAQIPVLEREKVFKSAMLLVKPEMGEFEIKKILKAVIDFSDQQRAEVVTNAFLLNTKEMEPHERIGLVEAVLRIPFNEIDQVTAFALLVITQRMQMSERAGILTAVGAVSLRERMDVIDHTLQAITYQMEAHDRIMMIEAMARASADQRPDLVRQAREGVNIFQQSRDAHVAPEEGINVRQGDRDQRVIAVIWSRYIRV